MVREAASRVLAGESLYPIRKDWNDRGARTSMGLPWRSAGVRKMLVRGSAAGYTERRGRLLQGAWKPILDWETGSRSAPSSRILSETHARWDSAARTTC